MSFLKRLFGGGSADETAGENGATKGEPVNHGDYVIVPAPQADGGQWRLAAHIRKDGREHHLIRADLFPSRDIAATEAVNKAKRVIDEQGDTLFQ